MAYVLISFLALLLCLGGYSLLSLRQDGWRRKATPALFAIVSTLSLVLMLSAQGSPKPHYLAWDKYEVIAVKYDEPNNIYLWAVPKGGGEPIGIKLPWKDEEAKQVRRMEMGGGGIMYDGWAPEDYDQVFHPKPIPAMPSKEIQ